MNFITRKIALAANMVVKSPDWPKYYFDYINFSGKKWLFRAQGMKFMLRSHSVDKWIVAENVIMDSYNFACLRKMNFGQVIDIGANIGAFSISAAQYFPKAKIIAFEPDGLNLKLLKQNIDLNHYSDRISIIDKAVSASNDDVIRLYKGADFGSNSTYVSSGNYQDVKNIGFDDISRLVKGDSLLKMDIEGGEIDIFTTKYLPILKKFKVIIVEYHHFLKTHNAADFEKFLEKNGFRFEKDDLIYLITAK